MFGYATKMNDHYKKIHFKNEKYHGEWVGDEYFHVAICIIHERKVSRFFFVDYFVIMFVEYFVFLYHVFYVSVFPPFKIKIRLNRGYVGFILFSGHVAWNLIKKRILSY